MSTRGPGSALSALLVCALVFAHAVNGPRARADEAEDTRRALEQLEEEIQRISTAQRAREAQRSEVQQRLRDSEQSLAALQQRLAAVSAEIAETSREIDRLESRAGTLKSAADAQQQRVAREIRRAFKGAKDDQLQLLLSQEDPQALARLLTYYRYVLGARNALLREYSTTLEEISAVERALQDTRASLQTQRAGLAARREELAAEQSRRQLLLAEIESALEGDRAALEERQRDRASLEELLAEIEAAMAAVAIPMDAQPFSEARGQMPWPVEGRITDRFGSPRNQGKMRWQGVRLSAAAGTTISAIHHGRVVYADWLRGSGLLLVIDHGEGYMSLYAHNETLLRDVGDWVSTGAPVATVGDSGGQSEAALYFEVRKDGTPTDPRGWCRG